MEVFPLSQPLSHSAAMGFPGDVWAPLAQGRPATSFSPGQIIYLQGTRAHQFYYIRKGTARCFMTSEEGEERTLTLHRAGDLIGEAAFFDGEPRVSSAIAVTPCQVVAVDQQQLTQVFAQHPDLAISMLRYLSRTVRLLSSHVDGSFLSADRRVARHLLSLPAAGEVLQCTHEEIGSSVGASGVTVSRMQGELERRGWLATGYRCVKLLDRTALAAFADGQEPRRPD